MECALSKPELWAPRCWGWLVALSIGRRYLAFEGMWIMHIRLKSAPRFLATQSIPFVRSRITLGLVARN